MERPNFRAGELAGLVRVWGSALGFRVGECWALGFRVGECWALGFRVGECCVEGVMAAGPCIRCPTRRFFPRFMSILHHKACS